MKFSVKLLLVSFFYFISSSAMEPRELDHLASSPSCHKKYGEILTKYGESISSLFNGITPQERIFIYYLYRAALPGNRILRDQFHRHAVEIIQLFEGILEKKELLEKRSPELEDINVEKFILDVETFLVSLWSNHGQYFNTEMSQNKRTPSRLDMQELTPDNLDQVLRILDYDSEAILKKLGRTIFDENYEATKTMNGKINEGCVNVYSSDFTDEDFKKLRAESASKLNKYLYIAQEGGKRVPRMSVYKIGSKYSNELEAASYWLTKAHTLAKKYPVQFDEHLVKSLELLIRFFHTGDENDFKEHSKEWLQSKSRIDYTFGFIENYDDPMCNTGFFEADVTIKKVDLKILAKILPILEKKLPFPEEFQREEFSTPNVSLNTIAFSSGGLGPLVYTAAYCLPNYNGIRSLMGSKQICYDLGKSVGSLLNPELSKKLFQTREQQEWLRQNDPDEKLYDDIWDIHVVLHETLGHGSGKLGKHVFKKGDSLEIGSKKYDIGDVLPVTDKNIKEFFKGNYSCLEELRAEIIALLSSIDSFDELACRDLFKEWPQKIGKTELVKQFILEMAGTAFRRLMRQSKDATEVCGAHARANVTILNYLLKHEGIKFIEEEVRVDNNVHTVLGLQLTDLNRAYETIKKLAIKVQTIKSTGDAQRAQKLIDRFGKRIPKAGYIKILKENQRAVCGNVKAASRIYPDYCPSFNQEGEVTDVTGTWPTSFVEQNMQFSKLALSKEY